jgi:hypothetical protein
LIETPPGGAGPRWFDDVRSLVERKNGRDQEHIVPPIPGPGYHGAYSAYFASPTVLAYSNGVIKLNKFKRPTVFGYMYGGIYSSAQQAANTQMQTDASNQVFQVTLMPNGWPLLTLRASPAQTFAPRRHPWKIAEAGAWWHR